MTLFQVPYYSGTQAVSGQPVRYMVPSPSSVPYMQNCQGPCQMGSDSGSQQAGQHQSMQYPSASQNFVHYPVMASSGGAASAPSSGDYQNYQQQGTGAQYPASQYTYTQLGAGTQTGADMSANQTGAYTAATYQQQQQQGGNAASQAAYMHAPMQAYYSTPSSSNVTHQTPASMDASNSQPAQGQAASYRPTRTPPAPAQVLGPLGAGQAQGAVNVGGQQLASGMVGVGHNTSQFISGYNPTVVTSSYTQVSPHPRAPNLVTFAPVQPGHQAAYPMVRPGMQMNMQMQTRSTPPPQGISYPQMHHMTCITPLKVDPRGGKMSDAPPLSGAGDMKESNGIMHQHPKPAIVTTHVRPSGPMFRPQTPTSPG